MMDVSSERFDTQLEIGRFKTIRLKRIELLSTVGPHGSLHTEQLIQTPPRKECHAASTDENIRSIPFTAGAIVELRLHRCQQLHALTQVIAVGAIVPARQT